MNNAARVSEIFTAFVAREYGFPVSEINKEFDVIANTADMNDYLRVSRVGRKLALNRKIRRDLYCFYENAQNHACFENEMLEGVA